MMIGVTAKTSNVLMHFDQIDTDKMLQKGINFSSATTMGNVQSAIEGELDKRGGKNFGPPGGKKMVIFLDDLSMPEINDWGQWHAL